MASNFLNLFGKKKEEALAPQATPAVKPVNSAIPAAGTNPNNPSPSSSAGRKRVTQRLSLKSIQNAAGNNPNPSKIQLPGAVNQPQAEVNPLAVDGTVDVPFSIILNCIPEQLLVADHQTLQAAPQARVEVGLPLSHILAMLPSGKLEFALSDLIDGIPEGFVQPKQNIEQYLATPIILPLAEIFKKIPPHLLSLRTDQRPVDSSVLSMNDPFSKEALEKAQAEALAKAEAQAALELEQQALAQALAEMPAQEVPELSYQTEQIDSVPDFDPVLLAEAEAALSAAEALKAGVELHNSNELIQPPTTFLQPTAEESEESAPAYAETEPEPNQENWAFPTAPSSAEESEVGQPQVGEQEPALEMDPALIEWARKMAEEQNPATTESVTQELAVEEPLTEEINQQEAVTAPTNLGALIIKDASMFDALNAPTRAIPRPSSQPKPPEIKGFAAFPVMSSEDKPNASKPAAEKLEVSTEREDFLAIDSESNRTGQEKDSPRIRLSPTINKYLGLDDHAEITFLDVMSQVRRWPGVSGCVITGKDGLPISAVVDDMTFSKSLSAFAPKIVSRVSELFVDLGMPEVQELHVPMDDVSTFLFREADVYFILLFRDASLPNWYRKVIKAVLEEIATRHK